MANVVKEISEFQTRDELKGDEFVQVSSTDRVNLKDQLDKKLNAAIEVPDENYMQDLIDSGKAIEGQFYYIAEES